LLGAEANFDEIDYERESKRKRNVIASRSVAVKKGVNAMRKV
jgi:hypothetical protein